MATLPPSPPPPPLPRNVFPYTCLPAEIRNLILEYALVPGDVYPCTTTTTSRDKEPKQQTSSSTSGKILRALFKRPSSSSSAAQLKIKIGGVEHNVAGDDYNNNKRYRRPGFQLLRTCKSVYRDGLAMFYSMNTFHLPVGSAADVGTWLEGLKREHRDMIRSVCLTFYLEDITPAVLSEMEKKWLWDIPLKTRALEQRMVGEVAYLLCWRYWQDKMDWVKKWEGLERVVVKPSGGDMGERVYDGEAFRNLDVKEERSVMDSARERVKGEMGRLVEEVGWKAVRKALMNGGIGSGG